MHNLMQYLNKTQLETYVAFEVEKKELYPICLDRGLALSTLHGHLVSAILLGLPVSFERLGIAMSDINIVEKKIRQPPINSRIYSKFY